MKSVKLKPLPQFKTVAQRITQFKDPIYMSEAAQGAAVFDECEAAKALLAKWTASDPRGTPTEIVLRDEKLANAEQNFNAVDAKFRTLRGDFGDLDQTDLPSNSTSVELPTPLTTCDVAHSFSGLRWTTEDAWKKPLADKPKWLRDCVVIPGSRGLSETRWNPVLIGGALVHRGHAKPNSVRARFQTMAHLQPWLETWKAYEADHFDEL